MYQMALQSPELNSDLNKNWGYQHDYRTQQVWCRRGHPPLYEGSLFTTQAALAARLDLSMLPESMGKQAQKRIPSSDSRSEGQFPRAYPTYTEMGFQRHIYWSILEQADICEGTRMCPQWRTDNLWVHRSWGVACVPQPSLSFPLNSCRSREPWDLSSTWLQSRWALLNHGISILATGASLLVGVWEETVVSNRVKDYSNWIRSWTALLPLNNYRKPQYGEFSKTF